MGTVHTEERSTGTAPWAMQFVVRVERDRAPTHTAVCEATATACLRLLGDERAAPGGPWHAAVQAWQDERIRKHVRRARAGAWRRVEATEGVGVEWDGASVRAFPPCRTDALPPALRHLQLEGLDLDDPDRRTALAPVGRTVVLAITPDPVLPTGKAAAAAAHAAQLAAAAMPSEVALAWRAAGTPLTVEHPPPGRWREILATAPVVVRDGGFTVVAPGTVTAAARWI